MARVLGRGEGAARYVARGSVMHFKALAEQDDGDFSLMERTLPPGGRRPPTRHNQLLRGLLRPRRVRSRSRSTGTSECSHPRSSSSSPGAPRTPSATAGTTEARLLVLHALGPR